jgi:hypothetical protein
MGLFIVLAVDRDAEFRDAEFVPVSLWEAQDVIQQCKTLNTPLSLCRHFQVQS